VTAPSGVEQAPPNDAGWLSRRLSRSPLNGDMVGELAWAMKCATCGEEHDLLEPSFRRPEAVVSLSTEERAERVKENDDLCAIWAASESERHRYFVRCLLKVRLLDAEDDTAWGLWAEVEEADFHRILGRWSDPDVAAMPPIEAALANRVPNYPDTIGLPVMLRLTGPTTRPELTFEPSSIHPFALECGEGVCTHRVMEWLAGFR
jgi:hypothetical protein